MSIVAFSFGSFGDIATTIQLLGKLRRALFDARAASSDIRDLTDTLDSYVTVLHQARRAITELHAATGPHLPQELHDDLGQAFTSCNKIILRMQKRIDEFERKTAKEVGLAACKRYWELCAWSIMGGHAEVDALTQRLARQLQIIQTLLVVSQSQNVAKIAENCERSRATVGALHDRMETISTHLIFRAPGFLFYDADGVARKPRGQASLDEFSLLMSDVDKFAPGQHLSTQFAQGVARWKKDSRRSLLKISLPADIRSDFRRSFIRGIEWEVEVPKDMYHCTSSSSSTPGETQERKFELQFHFHEDPVTYLPMALSSEVFMVDGASRTVAEGATGAMLSLLKIRRSAALGRQSPRDYIALSDFREQLVKEIIRDIASDLGDLQKLITAFERIPARFEEV